ncbi:calcium-binding protein P-like [Patiria miniata]|uniref:LITAF domain-containing protein n=1 Tax=Patiria miniata TaxID=46514 RepID=A0A914AWL9_PATMI|nr:calcium-binding protein P-like [Patiria miniata]
MSDPVQPPPGSEQPPPPYPTEYKAPDGSYPPPQGQPGYAPQGQPGYAPQGQPGYPPQGQPGYPPQGQPGYPPQGQPGYAPQGQPGYPPPGTVGYHAGTTVVTAQPAVTTVIQQSFREFPVQCQCPNCHNQVTSQVTYVTGTLAWLLCLIMFFFGLWICCFIPFCIDSCQDAIHNCPVCKYQLATFNRM